MLAEEVRCEEEDGIDEVRLGAAPVSPRDPVPVGERVAALEAALRRMDHEIRTRRLVVTDPDGSDRIVGEVEGPAVRTTPEAIDLQAAFASMLAAGQSSCAIEGSPSRSAGGLAQATSGVNNRQLGCRPIHGRR
jgi:hypothetical protein